MSTDRIDLIRQAVLKVQTIGTKPATQKADKKIAKLVDSVLKSEYCTSTSKADRVELLDFND